ncbi:MAG TPA: DUF3883 domain-containing protein [Candidatus Nanopelagicaceae bacterium]|nr:DUF3883 domain-containing protein [Candidatus Nanopelagicaceae bacterium]
MAQGSKLTGDLVSLETLGAWVFKCNPEVWDILAWIEDGNDRIDDWTIVDNYRSKLLAAGQPAIVWVSGPTQGAKALPGIWGVGQVVGSAQWGVRMSREEVKKGFWKDVKKGQAATYWVPLAVDLLPKPLDRMILATDPILRNAEVFKQPQGSNPSFLTKKEYASLQRLIKKSPPTPEGPEKSICIGDHGAGFGSAVTNAIVEGRAMALVAAHYEAKGYLVEDVSARKLGWDLTATSKKDKNIRHIEVKGVSGNSPKVFLTRNESRKARENPLWELAIVINALSAKSQILLYPARSVWEAARPFMWQADLTKSGTFTL